MQIWGIGLLSTPPICINTTATLSKFTNIQVGLQLKLFSNQPNKQTNNQRTNDTRCFSCVSEWNQAAVSSQQGVSVGMRPVPVAVATTQLSSAVTLLRLQQVVWAAVSLCLHLCFTFIFTVCCGNKHRCVNSPVVKFIQSVHSNCDGELWRVWAAG